MLSVVPSNENGGATEVTTAVSADTGAIRASDTPKSMRRYPLEQVAVGITRFLDLFRTTPDDPEASDALCSTCRFYPAVIDSQCFSCARRMDT
jgi:hypothetical protein